MRTTTTTTACRVIWVCLLCSVVSGCATTRTVTITTRPPDAAIRVDGVELGRGRLTHEFSFMADDTHQVIVSRPGFRDQIVTLREDDARADVTVELKPLTRRVTFKVTPAPAVVSVDGRPVSPRAVSQFSTDLEFWQDSSNQWNTHTITASAPGYQSVRQTVGWTGRDETVVLDLQPMRKDIRIDSTPAGATVFVDEEPVGQTPLTDPQRAFAFDPDLQQYIPKRVRLEKPGYDPVERTIGWDDGKTDYAIEMPPKTKTVRIITDPPGAQVRINGQSLPPGPDGAVVARLPFPPANDRGDLPTYRAVVSKRTENSEWETAELPIAWENGRSDYAVRLKEILTRPVELLSVEPTRGDRGWSMEPRRQTTLAMKDVTEGAQKQPPQQILRLPKAEQLDSVAVSPDGSTILFTVLLPNREGDDVRSQIRSVRADGSGGVQQVSDGRALELMPSYTPDGSQIVFSSNRGGSRLSVWTMNANGNPGITNLTTGDTNDLWPSIDADPQPRLFYVRLVDSRPDPRLYMTRMGSTIRTDLTSFSGTQPRVSPKADSVLFTIVNDKTGKRDVCRMSDAGGAVENLTNTPDADECDPVFSRDGRRVVFVSDRGIGEDKRPNRDIWVIDLARPDRPTQVTRNGSWDDSPAFDPAGEFIYFRSNRGGEWGIWKTSVK